MEANSPLHDDPAAWRQRVGGFVALPKLLRELGADPAAVLANAGLDARALSQPDDTIPYLAAVRLLQHAALQTGRGHFGLLAGERWTLSHLGALGDLMRNAPSVGDALQCLSVFQRLHSDVGAVFVLSHEHTVSLGYVLYREHVPHHEHAYDLALAFAYNLMRELCGPRWAATDVLLARHAPSDPTPYRQHFRATVRFDHEYSAVRFLARWCEQPIEGADPEVYRMLTDKLIANTRTDPVRDLRRSLRLLLLYGTSSADDLAQSLGLHRRTLNRRLQAAGTTFRRELDRIRFEVARQLLEHTRVPISGIAATLCYGDTAAFLHAFKRWTGTTPARWRASAGRRPIGSS
jgi:AraC-like DNA-binding protein